MHYLPVRALRLVVVGLLVAAGITIGVPFAYADSNASLGVSPAHGSPDGQFTAILRWQPPKHGKTPQCLPDQVTFEWDGAVLGRTASVLVGDSCLATLRATPPTGAYQGVSNHIIGVNGARDLHARYTVVAGSPATPGGSQPPAAAAATPESTSTAATDAQTNNPTDPAATSSGLVPAAPAVGAQPPGNSLSWVPGGIVALGTVLFLAGAGAFGVIVWRTRRAKAAAATEPLLAATEPLLAPTQPLPIPRQTGLDEASDSRTAELRPPTS